MCYYFLRKPLEYLLSTGLQISYLDFLNEYFVYVYAGPSN